VEVTGKEGASTGSTVAGSASSEFFAVDTKVQYRIIQYGWDR